MKRVFFILIFVLGYQAHALDCTIPLSEPLTSDALDEAIKICNVDSTTKLRNILPKAFRKNFTFIRHSASAFATCIDPKRFSPRIIMFSPNSDLILAMPWNPEMVGDFNCNAFETMELKKGASHLDLDLHSLPPIPAPGEDIPLQIAHVQSCISCHTESGTPIWSGYPNWKNKMGTEAYGFDDDNLIFGSQEAREYKLFLAHIARDGSKNSLIWPRHDKIALAKAMGEVFELTPEYMRLPPYQFWSKPIKAYNNDYRPNANLTQKINQLNSAKIYNLLRKHPLYKPLKLMVAFSDANCTDNNKISSAVPKIFQNKDLATKTGLGDIEYTEPLVRIAPRSMVDFKAFAKFIGLSEADASPDPMGLQYSPRGFVDGKDTSFDLLAVSILSHDSRFKAYLVKDSGDYLSKSDFVIPLQAPELCQKLREAMD